MNGWTESSPGCCTNFAGCNECQDVSAAVRHIVIPLLAWGFTAAPSFTGDICTTQRSQTRPCWRQTQIINGRILLSHSSLPVSLWCDFCKSRVYFSFFLYFCALIVANPRKRTFSSLTQDSTVIVITLNAVTSASLPACLPSLRPIQHSVVQ